LGLNCKSVIAANVANSTSFAVNRNRSRGQHNAGHGDTTNRFGAAFKCKGTNASHGDTTNRFGAAFKFKGTNASHGDTTNRFGAVIENHEVVAALRFGAVIENHEVVAALRFGAAIENHEVVAALSPMREHGVTDLTNQPSHEVVAAILGPRRCHLFEALASDCVRSVG